MQLLRNIKDQLDRPVNIAPLAMFRVIFGFMMFLSVARFWWKGWIKDIYIDPAFHFKYLGFEWVKSLGDPGMYILFLVMALASLLIMTGLFYRVSALVFFLCFTYVELIDKTTYLNHYYFVSIISFIMVLLPAHRSFSLDAKLFPEIKANQVPFWSIGAIQLQLGIVYFFAGVAKINPDWLLDAMPLRIWLPPHTDLPVVGFLMDEVWIAYFFSWFGCIYDLTIPFFLINKKTRPYAYFFVVAFHVLTWLLFNIGMFPWIMVLSTLIFFPAGFHLRIMDFIRKIFSSSGTSVSTIVYRPKLSKFLKAFLLIHFIVQLILPFRYLAYPGKLFWTEEGFRFSWRVMLMEKAGTTLFFVSDPALPGSVEIENRKYLTQVQEKMMATQPDMILQFAHFLADEFRDSTLIVGEKRFHFSKPQVFVRSWVTLNGSGSKPFIDPTVDLAERPFNLCHREWVLPFEDR